MGSFKKIAMQGLIAVAAVYIFNQFIGPRIGVTA